MKDIVTYLNEAKDPAMAFSAKYHANNAADFIKKAEKDGWEMDVNYDNWVSGDYVSIKLDRDDESLYIEWNDQDGVYDGKNFDKISSKLKKINDIEYRKKNK